MESQLRSTTGCGTRETCETCGTVPPPVPPREPHHADGMSDRGWIVSTMLDVEAVEGEVATAAAAATASGPDSECPVGALRLECAQR